MGRKARLKREKRENQKKIFNSLAYQNDNSKFESSVNRIKLLFKEYKFLDIALTICVSELWPMNVASHAKHALAWSILLGLSEEDEKAKSISNYKEFSLFLNKLYCLWPELPCLEDYSPVADWGQIKVGLDSEFVPIFYGSNLDRVPDFIESFRIKYASNPVALADMDLIIDIQRNIINSFDGFDKENISNPTNGYVEVPTEKFWIACIKTLIKTKDLIFKRLDKNKEKLITPIGVGNSIYTHKEFINKYLESYITPHVFLSKNDLLIPISVRELPGKIINYWANNKNLYNENIPHAKIAEFLNKHFENICGSGEPIYLEINNSIFSNLRITCSIAGKERFHLICYCQLDSYKNALNETNLIYTHLQKESEIALLSPCGKKRLGRKDKSKLCKNDIRITLVLENNALATSLLEIPEEPAQFLTLADFISIFDSMENIDEIEEFDQYMQDVNDETNQHNLFFNLYASPVDWYASFCDSKGVLFNGYSSHEKMVFIDPHWGDIYRFKKLKEFWHDAPEIFPDNEKTWKIIKTGAIQHMYSIWKPIKAYSTKVGNCTIQALYDYQEIPNEDKNIFDSMVQMIIDLINENKHLLVNIPFMKEKHIIFNCTINKNTKIGSESKGIFISNIYCTEKNHYHLTLNYEKIFDSCSNNKDNTYEKKFLSELLILCHSINNVELPKNFIKLFTEQIPSKKPRFLFYKEKNYVDSPKTAMPIMVTENDSKLVIKEIAIALHDRNIYPGKYTVDEAKSIIKEISCFFKLKIESFLISYNKEQLIVSCIEQINAALVKEYIDNLNIKHSLAHDVDYDREEEVKNSKEKNSMIIKYYRYLLEKIITLSIKGENSVNDKVLRKLYFYVKYYFDFNNASDILHYGIAIGGLDISENYIPQVFYNDEFENNISRFQNKYSKNILGIGINKEDEINSLSIGINLLENKHFNNLFRKDLNFDFVQLIDAFRILYQPVEYGLSNNISLCYSVTEEKLLSAFLNFIKFTTKEEATYLLKFLTLSESGILCLSGKEQIETEVPYWDHYKRIYRYNLRPLIKYNNKYFWGAEQAFRSMFIWLRQLNNGYLPADFNWPNVEPYIKNIKKDLEEKLEKQSLDIFKRYTPYVDSLDFYDKYKKYEKFDDVGDFDALAYWPEINTLIYAECKYNKPAFVIKDSRRLRDTIFGNNPEAHMKKIAKRRDFVLKNRQRMLEVLGWPPSDKPEINLELYITKDLHYWIVAPPKDVPTQFVCIDNLDNWLKNHVLKQD